LEVGLAARSMPRVFGRGSRSQPAALVSDRDDAALFPAIRILERYGCAKSGSARRGMSIARLDLRNSGDTASPRGRVVGYGSWALFEPAGE